MAARSNVVDPSESDQRLPSAVSDVPLSAHFARRPSSVHQRRAAPLADKEQAQELSSRIGDRALHGEHLAAGLGAVGADRTGATPLQVLVHRARFHARVLPAANQRHMTAEARRLLDELGTSRPVRRRAAGGPRGARRFRAEAFWAAHPGATGRSVLPPPGGGLVSNRRRLTGVSPDF